ncbi:S1 family peptidase [Streptomyces sp. NPDC006733]|uniref:S1 family peptidase n=1 Tax=Streptomyces sp. NPDC006733 TaxID=3155460 RepID=UPI00340EE720
MRLRTAAMVGITALLGAVITGAGPVAATAASAAPAAPDAVVTAMAHDLGLTKSAAVQRLRLEADATRIAPTAEQAAGASFGGSWFDAADGKLVVAVTTAAATPAVERTGARTTLVAHTSRTLDTAKARIDAQAKQHTAPAGVSAWRVDPRTNSVVIDVRADAAADPAVRTFLTTAQRGDTAGVVTVHRTATPAPTTLSAGTVGGDPYYSHGIRCSIGFSVYGGFISAGHCAQAGSAVYGWDNSYIGNFQAGTFPGNDYSWVNVGSGWWTVPVVLGWGATSDVLVRGSAEAPVGASVCRSGSTTHWHCGTILGKNQTVNYSQGSVYNLTRTNVCAEPGDSGGSFVTGDQAQGVTSGGWGNCGSGGETWFQPVNPILSTYHLTLHTA